VANVGATPLRFEENMGQTDPAVRFIARGAGYTIFLTPQEAVFLLPAAEKTPAKHTRSRQKPHLFGPSSHSAVVRMKMLGANTPGISGTNRLPGISNYFIGRNKDRWHTGIANYASATYSSVYPGIDMVYYGNQRQLEYDFVVQPGADPSAIKFAFSGVDETTLSGSGDLQMKSAARAAALVLHGPSIYQIENGKRKAIAGRYSLNGDRSIGITVPAYDHSKKLTIDPVLQYSTYVGGSGDDYAATLAVDPQGNSYIIGATTSPDFPTTGTIGDPVVSSATVPFITKIDSTGTTLSYSDYFGGSGQDSANGLAVDSNGYAYVVGSTTSTDFPISGSALQSTLSSGATNVFLSKFSADGSSLSYSTYLGGSLDDEAMSVAVDFNQNAYLTGYATSSGSNPFPTTSTAFQPSLNGQIGNAFLTRINTTQSGTASLIYSTYLGGANAQPFGDVGYGVALDSASKAYVTGETTSTDFPVTTTLPQSTVNSNGTVFASIIDTTQTATASLTYSTYLAGTGALGEGGYAVAVDQNQKIYLTGFTSSGNFPATTSVVACPSNPNTFGTVFVAKLDPTQSGASTLVYSTCAGGSGGPNAGDMATSIAVDPNGAAYYAGFTDSSDFPITTDALQSTSNTDVGSGFLSILNASGTGLLYSTFLGGSAPSDAWGLALDSSLNIYVDGSTSSTDLQGTSGEYQSSLAGDSNAFISKFSGLTLPFISSLSNNAGSPGAQITITGGNFGAAQGSSTVTFNEISATPAYWSATMISVSVPNGATTGNVIVTASNIASNALPFTVTPTPSISSLSTTSGPGGTPLTITGTSFGGTQGTSAVTFNDTLATVTNWSNTSIDVSVPLTATTGNVVVAVGGQQSNPVNFSVTVPIPNISGLSSSSGPVGAVVTITGTNFGASQLGSFVTFNAVQASAITWSATQIVAQVPTGATTGPVLVAISGQSSNGITYTVSTPPPSITSISPPAGGVGARVMLTGAYFGPAQGQGTVTVGSAQANVTAWSDTSITFIVPTGIALGAAAVTATSAAGITSNAMQFTLTQPLVLSPSTMTLLLGFSRDLQFTDENGTPLTGVSFVVTDNTIAEIDAPAVSGDPTTIRGLGVGTTTVVATLGSRSGQAQVTVAAVSSLSAGATAWTIAPTNGGYFGNAVQSVIVDNNTPAFYLSDYAAYGLNADGGSNGSAIRSFTSDGQPLWNWPTGPTGLYSQQSVVAADSQGGVIFWETDSSSNGVMISTYLGRLDESGNETWQHTLPYSVGPPSVAVHPDGTVFLVDLNAEGVSALDPTTGQVKFTVPIPSQTQGKGFNWTLSNNLYFPFQCTPGASMTYAPNVDNFGALSVDALGNVYLPLGSSTSTTDAEPCESGQLVNTQNSSWSYTGTLSLLVIHADGSYNVQTVDSQSTNGTNWGNVPTYFEYPNARAVPDGQGGVLLPNDNTVYHITSSGTQPISLPLYAGGSGGNARDPLLVGATGTAYLYGYPSYDTFIPSIVAFDSGTGSITWSVALSGSNGAVNLDSVLSDGSLVFDQAGSVLLASSTGQVSPLFSGATTLPLALPTSTVNQGNGLWGVTLGDGTFTSIQGPALDPADSYSEAGGEETRQAKEPQGVKFNSDPNPANAVSSACSGLDDTRHKYPRWLLVPLSGNNTAQVNLNHGWHNATIQSLDSTIATVSPASATNNTIITVTGVKAGVVNIQATNSDNPSAPPVQLTATVKPSISHTADIVKMIDNVNNLQPANMPDPTALMNNLNQIWGKQANIHFTAVNRPADVTVHWDLLPAPNGNGLLDDFTNGHGGIGDLTEANAILLANSPLSTDPLHFYAFYVNQFGPEKGVTCGQNQTCALNGLSYTVNSMGNDSYISGSPVGNINSVTAHEFGHLMGAVDVTTGSFSGDLMWKTTTSAGAAPCRVRQRDWQLVNPTTGDPN
jgi:hypothetical protein